MCKPIFHSVKRTTLSYYKHFVREGGILYHKLFDNMTPDKYILLRKIEEENGTLMIVQHDPPRRGMFAMSGIRALWYPKYGAGGWVGDDIAVRNLILQIEQEQHAAAFQMSG